MKNLLINFYILGSMLLLSCENQTTKKEEKVQQEKEAEQEQQKTDSLRKEVEKAE